MKIFIEKAIIIAVAIVFGFVGGRVFAGGNEKMTICHVASAAEGGDTVEELTITVSSNAAFKHFVEHRADYFGVCDGVIDGPEGGNHGNGNNGGLTDWQI